MISRKIGFLLLAVYTAAVISGCAAGGKVTDFDKNTTSVSKLQLADSGTLSIYDGNAVHEVALKEIKCLRIENDITTTYNRELYYRVEVVLRNGTTIGSLKNRDTRVYVAVNHYLEGESEGGPYRILLADVSRLEIRY